MSDNRQVSADLVSFRFRKSADNRQIQTDAFGAFVHAREYCPVADLIAVFCRERFTHEVFKIAVPVFAAVRNVGRKVNVFANGT